MSNRKYEQNLTKKGRYRLDNYTYRREPQRRKNYVNCHNFIISSQIKEIKCSHWNNSIARLQYRSVHCGTIKYKLEFRFAISSLFGCHWFLLQSVKTPSLWDHICQLASRFFKSVSKPLHLIPRYLWTNLN